MELALLILITMALLLCLYLFVTLKLEWGERDRRLRQFDAALAAIAAEVRDLEARAGELEQTASAPAPRPGMNLTIRSQVLRRGRQGEDPAQIAAALGLSRTEVDLLFKVERIGVAAAPVRAYN
ncbi:MAG: hypothetical protein ACE15B_06755 [Bryobacteraceae bacterium]